MSSKFAQRLASDPVLAEKFKKIEEELRAEVKDEIEAIKRSERFTAEDLNLYINY